MDWLIDLLARHGLALVFVNVLLTQLAVPVPSMPTLILAGALVAQGRLELASLVAVALAAALMGDMPWYAAGRRYGYRILGTLCRMSIEPGSCVKQTEDIFARWGPASLVFAKYVPGFAAVAPPLAGAMGLGLPRFLLYSALGAVLWAGLPIALGMVFHAEVGQAISWLEGIGTGAAAALVGIVLAYIAVKAAKRYLLIRFLRMARIGAVELRELMRTQSRPLVLDVRSHSARRMDPRGIPGAIAVDPDAPAASLAGIALDQELIVYCS